MGFLQGPIYGCMIGSMCIMCFLINVMSQHQGIDLYRTLSIIGYGMMPHVVLSVIGIVLNLKSTLGVVLSTVAVLWSTASSSRFFALFVHMQQQRWLMAYPLLLCYTFVTLLIVF